MPNKLSIERDLNVLAIIVFNKSKPFAQNEYQRHTLPHFL